MLIDLQKIEFAVSKYRKNIEKNMVENCNL